MYRDAKGKSGVTVKDRFFGLALTLKQGTFHRSELGDQRKSDEQIECWESYKAARQALVENGHFTRLPVGSLADEEAGNRELLTAGHNKHALMNANQITALKREKAWERFDVFISWIVKEIVEAEFNSLTDAGRLDKVWDCIFKAAVQGGGITSTVDYFGGKRLSSIEEISEYQIKHGLFYVVSPKSEAESVNAELIIIQTILKACKVADTETMEGFRTKMANICESTFDDLIMICNKISTSF